MSKIRAFIVSTLLIPTVLVVAIILYFWDLPVLDPVLAVLITLYILVGVIKNLKAMLPVFLQAVPPAPARRQNVTRRDSRLNFFLFHKF